MNVEVKLKYFVKYRAKTLKPIPLDEDETDILPQGTEVTASIMPNNVIWLEHEGLAIEEGILDENFTLILDEKNEPIVGVPF